MLKSIFNWKRMIGYFFTRKLNRQKKVQTKIKLIALITRITLLIKNLMYVCLLCMPTYPESKYLIIIVM